LGAPEVYTEDAAKRELRLTEKELNGLIAVSPRGWGVSSRPDPFPGRQISPRFFP